MEQHDRYRRKALADDGLHAERTYPRECCGAMLGHGQGDSKFVTEAVPLENAYAGEQGARYELTA